MTKSKNPVLIPDSAMNPQSPAHTDAPVQDAQGGSDSTSAPSSLFAIVDRPTAEGAQASTDVSSGETEGPIVLWVVDSMPPKGTSTAVGGWILGGDFPLGVDRFDTLTQNCHILQASEVPELCARIAQAINTEVLRLKNESKTLREQLVEIAVPEVELFREQYEGYPLAQECCVAAQMLRDLIYTWTEYEGIRLRIKKSALEYPEMRPLPGIWGPAHAPAPC